MDEEQRADVHPFLVIELVTTYMYMDEERRADFHLFLVILCAHYLFVAQYTLSWLHLSFRASAPTAIASSYRLAQPLYPDTHIANINSTTFHGKE